MVIRVEGNLPLRGSLRGRVFRDFQRFSEIFQSFSEVLSETLSEADFPQTLSVLFPLIVLPLELSPIWVWTYSGGVGAFHAKGWGSKSSVCPFKPREHKKNPEVLQSGFGVNFLFVSTALLLNEVFEKSREI